MVSKSKSFGWLPLEKGDTVDLVAPGFACKPEEVAGATEFLKSWGLVPRVPKKLFGRDVLCSNQDEVRLSHLREALLAPDSKAVWCLRGGYGSIRLLPELEKIKAPKGPAKLFIGLSDITSLHLFLNQSWGWPTVHGPLMDRFGRGAVLPKYVREMKKYVFGEMQSIEFAGLKPLNAAARKSGKIHAEVTGGNLITLQSSLATPWQWQTRGRILFFEDIGERGYKVDRVLEHFEQAGLFEGIKGIVFGDFTGGAEADGRTLLPAVLKRFAEANAFPVFSGLKSGHDVIQRPLPFATHSVLELGERGVLTCQTGIVQVSSKRATHAILKSVAASSERGIRKKEASL